MPRKVNIYFLGSTLVFLISLAFVLFLKPNKFESFDPGINFLLGFISIINTAIFLLAMHRFFKTWMRFDVLFLLGYLIVHLQIPFLASLGLMPEDPAFVFINAKVINYATWMSTMAILIWFVGFTMSLFSKKKSYKSIKPIYKIKTSYLDFIILISFILFLYLVGSDFLSGNYQGSRNWGSGSTYIFLLLNISLYIRIIYFFQVTQNVKLLNPGIFGLYLRKNIVAFSVICIYLLTFLLIGDRGPILSLGLLILSCYSLYQKKLTLRFIIILAFIGSIFFTIIGLGRGLKSSRSTESILAVGYDGLQNKESYFNPTGELANTVRLQYRVLDIVPNSHPHLFGGTMALEVISVIPFLGGYVIDLLNIPKIYHSSSLFFTIISQGPNYSWGEGTQLVADIYLNLGLYGVFIIMFLFGFMIARISVKAIIQKKTVFTIAYLVLITFSLYLNRSSLLHPLKMTVYILVINWMYSAFKTTQSA